MKRSVRFLPYDIVIEVEEGENLLHAAMEAGVHINASCGGEGVCGKCKIILESGELRSQRGAVQTDEEWQLGFRLACQSQVASDIVVRIPPESLFDRRLLRQKPPAARLRPMPFDAAELREAGKYEPAFQKKYLILPPPTLSDNVCDLRRLREGLKKQYRLDNITMDFFLTRKLAEVMRANNFEVTATLDFAQRRSRKPRLVQVESGNTTGRHYAIAIDIGTTTVWGQLLDLTGGEILGALGEYNAQISYGEDVISRIIYAGKPGGLQRLQGLVVGNINSVVKALLKKNKLKVEDVSHLTLAANTTMTHLFLGIDPKYIRLAPYTPTVCAVPPVRAQDLGLDLGEHVYVYCLSSVSSYVGGDIVSGVLGSGMYQEGKLTLFIDIGTNGEIVVGNRDWMACAACSAGPAFEGGGIRFGMRATQGAIEDVSINPDTGEPMLMTIGMVKPKGICGSGLINILATLMEAGFIEPNGRFREDLPTPRIRSGESGREYVLAYASETQVNQDIVLSEVDIDNLMRAKGAMYAGYITLLESVGLSIHDLEQIILAGAFGSFINIENAITIGLLPDLPLEKFTYVGNGSLLGATCVAFSREMLEEERRVALMMTNFELSETAGFMDRYMAALFLPHTQQEYFPTVMKRLAEAGRR
ncbi:ASKHA domain-containing protein [Desulfobacca acetoxidans]|uniref:ASKHA domain-containing protein n=1 Tax=Desulfobacca acetoxidans TaxID=60893 RepID=UPI0011D2186F|nr:ASKHA domain-containing protein [Desulfobacca acetoxidans]